MSGIRSTYGSTPAQPVETGKGTPSASQQVTPVDASSPTGGHSNQSARQVSTVSTLSEGSTISAIVTARATGGDTMLHTEVGNFRMASGSPIPVGNHVVLDVESVDDIIIARVISINGEKLASPPAVTLIPIVTTAAPQTDSYGLAGKLLPKDSGEGLIQNIATALGQSGNKPARRTPLPETKMTPQRLTAQITGQSTPVANSSFLAATLSTSTASVNPAQSQHSGTAAYAHTPNPGQRLTSAGSTVSSNSTSSANSLTPQANQQSQTKILEIVRLTIDHPPLTQRLNLASGVRPITSGTTLSAIVSNDPQLKNMTSTGIVISHSGTPKTLSGAQPVQVHVQTTSLGTLRYITTAIPAIGSQISFAITEKMDQFPVIPTPIENSAFKTPHLPIMTNWDDLRSALNMVAADNLELANSILNSRIPSPNSQLGASLLFFMSALKGGNLNTWLGREFQQSMEKLGHGDLFRSLSDDFSSLARINSDTGGQDWKAIVFPFYDGEALRQLKLFFRKHGQQNDKNSEEETRFIIELDLSRTGPVQLDGLFKLNQFNLVFRSQRAIDDNLKNKISSIFSENIEITGLTGNLTFRQITPFPVHPTEEWENAKPDILKA